MRSAYPRAQRVHLLLSLMICLSFGARVSAASEPLGPDIWSMQLDGGLLAPLEANGASPTAGVRYGKHVGGHLQIGMLTAWTFKRTKLEAPAQGPQGIESSIALVQSDASLVPLMGYLQVDLTDKARLVPFVGFGAGYEWLILHSKDERTGEQSKVRYNNVAWETYAGIGLRLNTLWRLNSELYYNGGSLEQKVLQPGGVEGREAVHVNAVGLRVGLDMKFD